MAGTRAKTRDGRRSDELLDPLLWAWEADAEYEEEAGQEWLFLLPGKWNRHVQYGWRMDPCELGPQGAQRRPPREPVLDEEDPCVTDAEYDPSDDFE